MFFIVKDGGEAGACNNTFDPQAARKKKGGHSSETCFLTKLTEQEGGPRRTALFLREAYLPNAGFGRTYFPYLCNSHRKEKDALLRAFVVKEALPVDLILRILPAA